MSFRDPLRVIAFPHDAGGKCWPGSAGLQPTLDGVAHFRPGVRAEEFRAFHARSDIRHTAYVAGKKLEVSGESFGYHQAEGFLARAVDQSRGRVEKGDRFRDAMKPEVLGVAGLFGERDLAGEGLAICRMSVEAADEFEDELCSALVQVPGEASNSSCLFHGTMPPTFRRTGGEAGRGFNGVSRNARWTAFGTGQVWRAMGATSRCVY